MASSSNAPSLVQTRKRTAHFALGQPKDLPKNVLPLEFEGFNQFKKLKEEDINCENKVIAEKIAVQLIDLWKNKGNLPTEGLYSVQKKVEVLYNRGRNILKIPRERREKMFDREEEEGIKRGRKKKINLETFENLFDICTCKHMSREDCYCPA